MKIAIIGGGCAGLACALECERLGLEAELYERNINVGWSWIVANKQNSFALHCISKL